MRDLGSVDPVENEMIRDADATNAASDSRWQKP
jgi:hypothetical protein